MLPIHGAKAVRKVSQFLINFRNFYPLFGIFWNIKNIILFYITNYTIFACIQFFLNVSGTNYQKQIENEEVAVESTDTDGSNITAPTEQTLNTDQQVFI